MFKKNIQRGGEMLKSPEPPHINAPGHDFGHNMSPTCVVTSQTHTHTHIHTCTGYLHDRIYKTLEMGLYEISSFNMSHITCIFLKIHKHFIIMYIFEEVKTRSKTFKNS